MTATGAEAGNDLTQIGPAAPAFGAEAVLLPAQGVSAASSKTAARAGIATVLALIAAFAAWFLLRHGVRTDAFPPFISGESSTPITRYSGPWITAAAGMALVAGLLLLFAVADVVRWSRGRARSAG